MSLKNCTLVVLGRPNGRPGRALRLLGAVWVAWGASAGGSLAADPADLDAALTRLQSGEPLMADAAVEELVAWGPPAVDALLPLLSDPRRDVRAGAIRGLGLLADERASAPLRAGLEASLDTVEPDDFAARYHRILLIQALGRLRDPEAHDLLRAAAGRGDAFERAHAAISLFLSGADPGYDLVLETLEMADPALRHLAVAGLAESEDDRARELLLASTADESWIVRDGAYQALHRWRDREEVRAAYRRGAKDSSWYVRQTVEQQFPE